MKAACTLALLILLTRSSLAATASNCDLPTTPNGPKALTVAGEDYTGTQPPLLISSTNSAETWTVQNPITNLPTTGFFLATSCGGVMPLAVCTAVGQDLLTPILTVSSNGGQSWTVPIVEGLPITGLFNTTSCTGTGACAICIAAGQDYSESLSPLLAVSTDGGSAWRVQKDIENLPLYGAFTSTSCTGNGATAVCVASGQSVTGPLLIVSNDGAVTWHLEQSIQDAVFDGQFNSVSCTGNDANIICVAVGQGVMAPLLAVSTDAANTWTVDNVFSSQNMNSQLRAVSCTGQGSSAVCVAVGNQLNGPLIVTSNNGGATFTTQVHNLPSSGIFNAVSCTGEGATAICTIGGIDNILRTPLLAVSLDAGKQWSLINIPDIRQPGQLITTHCVGKENTAICVAAGRSFVDSFAPLLFVSKDGGKTWAKQDIDGLPSRGVFNSSGGSF